MQPKTKQGKYARIEQKKKRYRGRFVEKFNTVDECDEFYLRRVDNRLLVN